MLLRVEALIRNRSASRWQGRGKYAFVHANGGNRLIRPGVVGAVLESPLDAGETMRVSDVFVVPKKQKSQFSVGRYMKAVFSAGASELDNAARALRERFLDDDGEPTSYLRGLMREGAEMPPDYAALFPTGQRQTIQVQLEPVDGGNRWDDDLRLCNNFLQLSFVVDGRGVAKGFRMSQKGPDSYRAFHTVRVPVHRN